MEFGVPSENSRFKDGMKCALVEYSHRRTQAGERTVIGEATFNRTNPGSKAVETDRASSSHAALARSGHRNQRKSRLCVVGAMPAQNWRGPISKLKRNRRLRSASYGDRIRRTHTHTHSLSLLFCSKTERETVKADQTPTSDGNGGSGSTKPCHPIEAWTDGNWLPNTNGHRTNASLRFFTGVCTNRLSDWRFASQTMRTWRKMSVRRSSFVY